MSVTVVSHGMLSVKALKSGCGPPWCICRIVCPCEEFHLCMLFTQQQRILSLQWVRKVPLVCFPQACTWLDPSFTSALWLLCLLIQLYPTPSLLMQSVGQSFSAQLSHCGKALTCSSTCYASLPDTYCVVNSKGQYSAEERIQNVSQHKHGSPGSDPSSDTPAFLLVFFFMWEREHEVG